MKKAWLITLLLLLAFFCFSCKKGQAEQTALYCGDDPIINCRDNGFIISGGDISQRLTLENDRFESLSVTIYSKNGKTVTISAEKGERSSSRSPKGELSAIAITADGNEQAYALTKKGLDSLLASECKSITIIDNINNEGNLTINRPVSIFARSYWSINGDLYYITDEEGELSLSGNISARKFACSAPASQITVPENLVPQKSWLYINAESLNGNTMSQEKRWATSVDELSELMAQPAYFNSEREAVVVSGIDFDSPFIIGFPCRLKIEDNCKNTENLIFETDKEGEIELLGDFDYKKISINAPNCNIKWENSCRLDQAPKNFSVKSLNGYDVENYVLGGEGKNHIISAKMKKEDALASCDIIWKADKNILSATVSGVVAPSELRNAKLSFETDGGKVTVDASGKGENGGIDLLSKTGTYVSVTDKNGKKRKYLIKTKIETKLPIVVIETENRYPVEDRQNYIDATFSIENDFAPKLPSMDEATVQIKGRGNSTWNWFDKKPYKIKFHSDVSLLGLQEGKEWVLLANYADNSLIRNYVALESAKVLDNMDCYASQYPVDLFINGEYMGVYSLGEQIEVGSSRVELHSNAKSVDTGFFLEIGGTHESDGENSFSTRYMQYIKVLNPKGTSFTEKHKTYIENYFSLADEAVRKTNGYEDFIDIDSLIDWLILTELSFNSDGAMRRSVYMKKDHGGKIEMGPVWDFDIAYGNSETDYENYNAWCCLATDHNYVYENWICALMEDEEFVELLRNRWNEIKNKLYQASMNAFDNGSAMVAPSAAANFEKWNTLGNKVTLQPEFMEQYDTYEKQTEYLKSFIENRFNWIDKQLNGEKAD